MIASKNWMVRYGKLMNMSENYYFVVPKLSFIVFSILEIPTRKPRNSRIYPPSSYSNIL